MHRYNNSRSGYQGRDRHYDRDYDRDSKHSYRDRDRAWTRDRDRYERNASAEQDSYRERGNRVKAPESTINSDKKDVQNDSEKADQKSTEAVSKESTPEDAKKLERLKKLEAWKKKQEERKREKEKVKETSPVTAITPKKSFLKTKPIISSKLSGKPLAAKSVKKPNVFADSDDEQDTNQRRVVFKPVANANEDEEELFPTVANEQVEDEADPLDAYMNQIEGIEDVEMKNGDDIFHGDNEEDDNEGNYEFDEDNEAGNLLKKLKSKKTKDLHIPKYNLKELEPFPKNFLVEMESIDPDEVINFRVMNNIFINNKKINPVMNFYHFGLDSQTLSVINNDLRFANPTAIQSQTIPAIMSGKDVIGIGRTGSGKTMCFLLSMLKHIKQQKPLGPGETGPLGLILSPTRELALQIFDACQVFLKGTNIRAICCTGGSELNKQINDIKKGVQIIVATPGRFIDLLTLNNGKLLKTERVTFVTLDEADRLFDLGFEPQINQIMKTIRPDKQCVLFSATFPTKLQNFAVKILKKPVIIAVGNKQVVNENITQQGKMFETEDEKFNYLLSLLGKQVDQKTIIFCDSQVQVNFMNRRLTDKGYSPVSIHAGLPAHERTNNLSNFRKSANILICTEVLSRGLDVPEVNLVVLYNAARTFAQYVHTTGRTARGASKGIAISLLSKGEDTQAYILLKCMVEDEIPPDIKELALEFEKELKAGKKKISSGFGGKGLDHLDKLRDETEKSERKKYGEDDEEKKKTVVDSDGEEQEQGEVENGNDDDVGPNIDIVYNSKADGSAPDSGVYNAKINVNDLPQNVRWIASNNTTLSKIIEQTSTSVTYKGRFYPEGQQPKEGEEPKLYLLVEGEKDYQVSEAVELFKKIIIDGLKKATTQQDRSGKFSI